MAYGFDWRKAGIRHNVGQGPVHLRGPSAKRNLYGRLYLQGPSRGVVTAETSMDFGQGLPSLFFGDTSLKDSGSAFLVELSVMDLVGFRAPNNATSLILVLRKLLLVNVGQEGFGPWSNDCHDDMRRRCYFDG